MKLQTLMFNIEHEKSNKIAIKLVDKKINTMLEVGFGTGIRTVNYLDAFNLKTCTGLDIEINPECINNRINKIKGDANLTLPFRDNKFDLILSNQNIEHLYNTRYFLEECYRCLSKEGILLVTTENLSSWINILALILGWQPFSLTNCDGFNIGNPIMVTNQDYKKECNGVAGHIRVFAMKGLIDLLHKVGFKEVKVKTTGYLPFWGILSDLFCKIDKKHGHFLIIKCKK